MLRYGWRTPLWCAVLVAALLLSSVENISPIATVHAQQTPGTGQGSDIDPARFAEVSKWEGTFSWSGSGSGTNAVSGGTMWWSGSHMANGSFELEGPTHPDPSRPRRRSLPPLLPLQSLRPLQLLQAQRQPLQSWWPGRPEEQPGIAPLLTLAINSSRKVQTFQGWPVLIETSLEHPDAMLSDGDVHPITVGGASQPWSSAVRLRVTDASGKEQSWPVTVASAPAGVVTLDSDSVSSVYWSMSAEQTGDLAEGTYQVTAVLDTSGLAGGWKGTVESVPVSLTIDRAPAALSRDQESLKVQLMANEALLRGQKDKARNYVEAQLAKKPDDIAALELKGDLLVDAGQADDALQAYSEAIRSFQQKKPEAEEAPFSLISKQHAMLDTLLEDGQP